MNISKLKLSILLCREANITSFTWGHRGLGKSQTHAQIAQENRWGFIDMRLSQCEASDLRGLPKGENGLTVYLPPAELPQGHSHKETCPACDPDFEGKLPAAKYCKGLLFLDELNRAEDDVIQAAFQIVLDRQIGTYRLPDGWSVHCAGNYSEGYQVNRFNDPAFVSRFAHFDLTVGDEYIAGWSDFMVGRPGYNKILQFCSFNPQHLTGVIKGDRGFMVQPSPRSWEMISRVEGALELPENAHLKEAHTSVIAGLIGMELAAQFDRFNCEITPQDVLEKGLTKDVLTRLKGLARNSLMGLVWGVASNAKIEKTQKVIDHTLDFMEWIAQAKERDLAVMLGRSVLLDEAKDPNAAALLTNADLAKMLVPEFEKQGKPSWIVSFTKRPDLYTLMQQVAWYGKSQKSKEAVEPGDTKKKKK